MNNFENSLNAVEALINDKSKQGQEIYNKENEVYRLGLNRKEHARAVLLGYLISKRFDITVGKDLPSAKLNNAYKKSKFLNNPIFYSLILSIWLIGLIFLGFSKESLIFSLIIIMCYVVALIQMIKSEKYIRKYIMASKKNMSEDLLKRKFNVIEYAYEILRTRNAHLNRKIKIRLNQNYKNYIYEYRRCCKNSKKNLKDVNGFITLEDLIKMYEDSLTTNVFLLKIIIEDVKKHVKDN